MRQSSADQVTVIGAGVTLYEANKAADSLAESGIHVRVIDPFTIKPLDVNTILNSAKQTGGRVVVVEDHYPEGMVLTCESCLYRPKDMCFVISNYFVANFNCMHVQDLI